MCHLPQPYHCTLDVHSVGLGGEQRTDKVALRSNVSHLRSNIRTWEKELTLHGPGTVNYEMDETWRAGGYVTWLGDRVPMAETVKCLPESMFPSFTMIGILSS